MSPGSVHVKPEDSDRLLEVRRPAVLQMILLATGPRQINKKLVDNSRHTDNGWAVRAMHEARILRNCAAHGSGVWSDEAVRQFNEQFEDAQLKPIGGKAFTISVDDIFAYRRAGKTVLNEAARLLRATNPPARRSSKRKDTGRAV